MESTITYTLTDGAGDKGQSAVNIGGFVKIGVNKIPSLISGPMAQKSQIIVDGHSYTLRLATHQGTSTSPERFVNQAFLFNSNPEVKVIDLHLR